MISTATGPPPRGAAACVRAACGILLLLLAVGSAAAQSVERQVPADYVQPPPHPNGYWFPDFPDNFLEAQNIKAKYFTIDWGLAFIGDYTLFQQNPASVAQVGEQNTGFALRDFRLMGHGWFQLFVKWTYLAAVEYNGFERQAGDPIWSVTDLWVATKVGPLFQLKFGKQKESFVYEVVGDAANLQQDERFLSPFFTTRNVGVSLSNTFLDEHGTWTLGWFNDFWTNGQAFTNSGNDFAGRLTFLPIYDRDGTHYLHLAVSGRYHQGDDDALRYRGQPQSFQATSYVDTGTFIADHSWSMGFEGLYADGPLQVSAEYVKSWVPSDRLGNPSFYGYYGIATWTFTGIPRPYDREVAYARRPPVQGHYLGALEVFARYGRVNLNSGSIQGGAMNEWYGGLNWYATARWKLGFGYGNVDLERFGVRGRTNIFLWRLQWIH